MVPAQNWTKYIEHFTKPRRGLCNYFVKTATLPRSVITNNYACMHKINVLEINLKRFNIAIVMSCEKNAFKMFINIKLYNLPSVPIYFLNLSLKSVHV